MKKIYRKLTQEQKKRGVIFSSTLTFEDKNDDREDLITHEVMSDDSQADIIISRLLDDSFFNDSPYKYNLIRR